MLTNTGNWDPKTQEARYSTKIPTQALRVMAGFDNKELYWLPRAHVDPPESLQKQIFPFLEQTLDKIFSANQKAPFTMEFN